MSHVFSIALTLNAKVMWIGHQCQWLWAAMSYTLVFEVDALVCLLDGLHKLHVSKLGKKFYTLKNGLMKWRDTFSISCKIQWLHLTMTKRTEHTKVKIKFKKSCTVRSGFGTAAFLGSHTVVETAKKHKQTPFNAIQALFKAWRFVMHLPLSYL